MANKVVKSVAFNITNDTDKKLLEFIETVNFSGYIKELMLMDFEKRNQKMKMVERTERLGIKITIASTSINPLPFEVVRA